MLPPLLSLLLAPQQGLQPRRLYLSCWPLVWVALAAVGVGRARWEELEVPLATCWEALQSCKPRLHHHLDRPPLMLSLLLIQTLKVLDVIHLLSSPAAGGGMVQYPGLCLRQHLKPPPYCGARPPALLNGPSVAQPEWARMLIVQETQLRQETQGLQCGTGWLLRPGQVAC